MTADEVGAAVNVSPASTASDTSTPTATHSWLAEGSIAKSPLSLLSPSSRSHESMPSQRPTPTRQATGTADPLLLLLVPFVLGFPDVTRQQPAVSYRFAPPARVKAAGKPIDTDVGHAAPLVVDFDVDGKKDLLVGQFGDGILWCYKNVGSNAQPQYAAGVKFKTGQKEGRVPTG